MAMAPILALLAVAGLWAAMARAQEPRQYNTSCWPGSLGGGDIHVANLTIEQAAAWCHHNRTCQGFTAKAPYPSTCAAGRVQIFHFKDVWGANHPHDEKGSTIWQMAPARPEYICSGGKCVPGAGRVNYYDPKCLGQCGTGTPHPREVTGRRAPFVTLPVSTGPTNLTTWTIPNLGGSNVGPGGVQLNHRWDGFVAKLSGDPSNVFKILGPLGGCTATKGVRGKTSANARAHKCRYAVNGGPFSMDTGACIGQNIGVVAGQDHQDICPDCTPYGVSFALADSGRSWAIGSFANDSVTRALRATQLITGFGWVLRDGAVPGSGGFPGNTSALAPRTAVGVTRAGELIILEVDGCEQCSAATGGSKGLDLHTLGERMLSLGCVHAINLDGGGSSSVAINGSVADFPTDYHIPIGHYQERAVSTVVCVL